MTIYASHGIVHGHTRRLETHRNLIDTERFSEHLAARTSPYVDLLDALHGHGDALTIDDATVAGGNAARLCRELGHEVTLFINPYNVESGKTYVFSILNTLVDALGGNTVHFEGEVYKLKERSARKSLRKRIKFEYSSIPDVEAQAAYVRDIASMNGIGTLAIPSHLDTLGLDDIRSLANAGVRIENHGWTHRHIRCLPWEAVAKDVECGREWIAHTLGTTSEFYAVPFGDMLPATLDHSSLFKMWFLLTDVLSEGRLGRHVLNRASLCLPDGSSG